MLDEKDIEKIQSMIDQAKDDMLKQSAANTRVIIESSVMKKLDLLIEGQQSLLDTLAPKSRVEELEEEITDGIQIVFVTKVKQVLNIFYKIFPHIKVYYFVTLQ